MFHRVSPRNHGLAIEILGMLLGSKVETLRIFPCILRCGDPRQKFKEEQPQRCGGGFVTVCVIPPGDLDILLHSWQSKKPCQSVTAKQVGLGARGVYNCFSYKKRRNKGG